MFPAKAKMAQELLEGYNNEFWLLTWPSNSPDLNPIEYEGCAGQTSPPDAGPTSQLTGLEGSVASSNPDL